MPKNWRGPGPLGPLGSYIPAISNAMLIELKLTAKNQRIMKNTESNLNHFFVGTLFHTTPTAFLALTCNPPNTSIALKVLSHFFPTAFPSLISKECLPLRTVSHGKSILELLRLHWQLKSNSLWVERHFRDLPKVSSYFSPNITTN